MKNVSHDFAIRKARRELRWLAGFLGSWIKVALLLLALAAYWRWNHDAPVLGPVLMPERRVIAANVSYVFATLGLAGSAALIAVGLEGLRSHARMRK